MTTRLALALLLAWAAGAVTDNAASPNCHPDCTKLGNCAENGQCICPFGRTGEACEVDVLAPCRMGPGLSAHCDLGHPQSCECVRRCREYGCPANSTGAKVCHWQLPEEEPLGCYEREGVTPDEQYSLVPEEAEEAKYFESSKPGAKQVNRSAVLVTLGGMQEALPLSSCPKQCSMRGHCSKVSGRWSKAQCSCFRGFSGKACEAEENSCLLGCLGRGTCDDAFCHCRPPHFSLGCSRSRVYPGVSRPSPVNFKIYMYELPTRLVHDLSLGSGEPEGEHIHMAHQKFLEQFLVSAARTEDPSEANLFLVPAMTWSYGANTLNADHLNLVADYVAHALPYWNRTHGRDHIFWVTNDRGACGLTGTAEAAIKLTHFGLAKTNASGSPPAGLATEWYDCFHPLRDVVAPPHDVTAKALLAATAGLSADDIVRAKKTLLFFTGTVSNDSEYSGGTRQQLHELARGWKDPDIVFKEGGFGADEHASQLRQSKFCLAVYGYGFGMRLLTCLFGGSVPVIIQERVAQPLEDLLPYEAFSLRLNNRHLPDLPRLLRAVEPEQYQRLVEGLLRYRQAFLWDAQAGGRAFEYTVASLRRRHLNFKSLHF